MNSFKLTLDNTLMLREKAIVSNQLPTTVLNFINSMLDGAITKSTANNREAMNMLTYVSDLIQYHAKPEMALWDSNASLNDYLLKRKPLNNICSKETELILFIQQLFDSGFSHEQIKEALERLSGIRISVSSLEAVKKNDGKSPLRKIRYLT